MSYVECNLVITNGKVSVPCYCHLKDLMLNICEVTFYRRLFHSPNAAAFIRDLFLSFLCSNHNEENMLKTVFSCRFAAISNVWSEFANYVS